MTTVREARIEAALRAIQQAKKQAGICRVEIRNIDLAEAVVDALFTDHSMDHFTVRTPAEREAAEFLPGD